MKSPPSLPFPPCQRRRRERRRRKRRKGDYHMKNQTQSFFFFFLVWSGKSWLFFSFFLSSFFSQTNILFWQVTIFCAKLLCLSVCLCCKCCLKSFPIVSILGAHLSVLLSAVVNINKTAIWLNWQAIFFTEIFQRSRLAYSVRSIEYIV